MPSLAIKHTLVAGSLMLAAAAFTALPALAQGHGGGGGCEHERAGDESMFNRERWHASS